MTPALTPSADFPARLAALRSQLARHGVAGFLQPRADRHQGEMAPACDERLAWLTGFTGSVGMALIGPERAGVIVDGRYELQAARELDAELYETVKLKEQKEWAQDILSNGAAGGDGAAPAIGYDPWLLTPAAVSLWEDILAPAGARLVPLERNPVDELWSDRPAPPSAPARAYPEALAGRSAAEKRAALAESLRDEALDAAALTLPDAIAWLLNIRGADIPHTPVALAFALLGADASVRLFTDPAKFDDALRARLGAGVTIEPWEAFDAALGAMTGRRVAVEKASAPQAVASLLEAAGAEVVWRRDPTSLPKARKTAAEIEGARAAQRRDGAALAECLAWIDAAAPQGGLTELAVAAALTETRRRVAARLGSELLDESFAPIVGFGPNGAVVHYRVTEESSLAIQGDGLLLLDSGGQYPDGTTDVTRTVAIGAPDAQMRRVATLVLKGMIAVTRMAFPARTTGRELDPFARAPLWSAGLDYNHGTGHGVGACLSVHEGPQSLSRRGDVALEAGMILSNEPGCYLEGRFGVRIENLVLVEPAAAPADALGVGGEQPVHRFETLTLAPIDRRLIEPALLSAAERAWLDAYHARVLEEIGPLIAPEAAGWLRAACAPL
ncbi:MAG: aminopeptidase P family protein [Pseudomonadota bacterium]